MKLPLLIGGATTSRQHTALKIAPGYEQMTVHVLDASRAVGVVAGLLDPKQKEQLDHKNREDQARLRELHGKKAGKKLLPLEVANENRLRIEWRAQDLATPSFVGRRKITGFPLGELTPYIDWTFFFTAWELKGKFPAILEHPNHGEAARDLYETAQKLLARIVDERLLRANAVYGFWPANSEGNDLVLWDDASTKREVARFPMLRQQQVKTDDKPYMCLSDFVAPKETGLCDHVGAFAVTAGLGVDALATAFQKDLDDYSAIIVKALADRLAEAFAELLHQRARRDWRYGATENLSHQDLTDERYRGIRPAFGYPACPDHTEKGQLFDLLAAPEVEITLSEHYAMMPAASVSGIYLAHPETRYFAVGKIDRDQVADYAKRKKMTVAEVERWLSPNLGYEP
jgi:5-methyltetrahydrofolate--homocysteine methyltransferase